MFAFIFEVFAADFFFVGDVARDEELEEACRREPVEALTFSTGSSSESSSSSFSSSSSSTSSSSSSATSLAGLELLPVVTDDSRSREPGLLLPLVDVRRMKSEILPWVSFLSLRVARPDGATVVEPGFFLITRKQITWIWFRDNA